MCFGVIGHQNLKPFLIFLKFYNKTYSSEMCINKEVSLAVFVVVTILNILLIIYFEMNLMVILWVIIIEYIILMQLIDYLLWTNKECGDKNRKISIYGMILNILQPVVIYLVFIFMLDIEIHYKIIATIIIFAYIFYIIYSTATKNPKIGTNCVSYECDRINYYWWDLSNPLMSPLVYLTVLFLMIILLVRPFKLALGAITVIFGTLVISILLTKGKCVGGIPSVWCLCAVVLPIFIFLYFYFN